MPNSTLADYPELFYTVDRGRFKSPPPVYDGKRDIPGTKKDLRIVSQSRQPGTNVWRCVLHLRSAN